LARNEIDLPKKEAHPPFFKGRLGPSAAVTGVPVREDSMAGYGLFVLMLAVGTATVGYFWLRND
jgi:hypothetical protein